MEERAGARQLSLTMAMSSQKGDGKHVLTRRRVLGNMGSHMIAGPKFAVVMMVVMRGAGGAQSTGIYRKSNLS